MYLQPGFCGMLRSVDLYQERWIEKQIEGRMNLPSDKPGHLKPMEKEALERTIVDYLAALDIVDTQNVPFR